MNTRGIEIYEKLATEHMQRGDYKEATKLYENARKIARTDNDAALLAHLHCMMGICLRLDGNLQAADIEFGLAEASAKESGDRLLLAQIRREYALVHIDLMHRGHTAHQTRARKLIKAALKYFEKADDAPAAELWVTVGYSGRLDLKARNRGSARYQLRVAYERLSQLPVTLRKPDYELDALINYLQAAPRDQRKELAQEARALIKETGQKGRTREVKLLVLGGPWLYRLTRNIAAVLRS